jgi:thiamine transport system substrate-binding protein
VKRSAARIGGALVALAFIAGACGSDSITATPADTSATVPTPNGDRTVTVIAYDSFTPSKEILARLTEETGITVKIVTMGDTGELVNRAIITKDAPLGDVLWGVDNTFVSRAVRAGIFAQHRSAELESLDPQFRDLVPGNVVTAVDFGDVCLNIDRDELAARGITEPTSVDQLIAPEYKSLTVVQDPARSSPGLAFLLATIEQFGEDGWQEWWQKMRENDLKVVSSWDVAWNTEFSGAGDGKRPIVVSYGSSPPAVVMFGPDPNATSVPVGVMSSSCFRQVEFAGVLQGSKRSDDARRVIDFFLGEAFQADMASNLFVFPVRSGVSLPDVFTRFAVIPEQPLTMTADRIANNRDRWVDEWTRVFD